MGVEIERKFLLAGDGWRSAVECSERLAQGYLGGERAALRVRIAGTSAWLTLKSRNEGRRRLEFEYAIPHDDAEQILAELCLPGRIDKVRHHLHHAGRRWEIDEFEGANAGLVLAEIELEREDATFARPDWLGAEVTEVPRYYNAALAERPFSSWSDLERTAC